MSKSIGSSLRIIFDHFFTVIAFTCFSFSSKFSYLFYFTRTMKIITARRPWVLTEESPSGLTTMDDHSTLAVFAGYYTIGLFPLPVFLSGVAGIHPGLINLNEIKTPALECLLPCIERDSLCFCLFTRAFLPSQA